MSDATTKPFKLETSDGKTLGGTLYPAQHATATMIVNGATGVPHQFYQRFAKFFQAKQWNVVCYDYRGTGMSRPESLVGFEANASDWGLFDIPAVLNWTLNYLGTERVYYVGHSAGGQQAGLIETPEAITAMLTVSSQSGYWRLQGKGEKLKVLFTMSIMFPLLCKIYGYFPWSKFASGEDLSKGIALQWAKWCLSPGYILDDPSLPLHRYQNFKSPIMAYSIDDDGWGTAHSVDAMMNAYPNVEREHLVPSDFGIAKLGHMGYFRAGAEKLWINAYEWLSAHTD